VRTDAGNLGGASVGGVRRDPGHSGDGAQEEEQQEQQGKGDDERAGHTHGSLEEEGKRSLAPPNLDRARVVTNRRRRSSSSVDLATALVSRPEE
jgi:hypothetical protein